MTSASAGSLAPLHQSERDREQQESDGPAPVAYRWQQDNAMSECSEGADGERQRGEADQKPAE
jgi:hypothetical protein